MIPAKLKIDRPTRILVDRRKAVGDVIMITPLLRELRKRYGADAFIQVVTEETTVLTNNPDVSLVVSPTDVSRADPWDMYINLNDAYESNITCHYVDAYLYRAFGATIDDIDRTMTMAVSDEERANVDEVITDHIGDNYVVVHMRRWAWENKNVDPTTWSMLFAYMEAKHPGVKIVSVGAQHDLRAPTTSSHYADLNEQLSFGEIKHLISRAKFFIGGDSGPYHIACTTDTPIIALLSHLAPEQILPWRDGEFGKNVHVVQSKVPCVGCYARQVPPVRQLKCENPEAWACNKAFEIQDITNIVTGILTNG